jgi:predicted phosphate transport protein (TIGR00153 family)
MLRLCKDARRKSIRHSFGSSGDVMLGWFQALMPREQRFFDLFAQHSEAVLGGAEALRAMLEGGDAVQQYFPRVMEREHAADNVTRDVLIAVRRTLITPFDRGAIRGLITSMDNGIDQMQKTAKSIVLFDVRSFEPEMREMADAIVSAAKLVREAVLLLGSLREESVRLAALTEQISAIEGRADELHDTGLKILFQKTGSNDAMAFIVGNEIYDHLEKVTDRFDDVANEIHGIVIDHA